MKASILTAFSLSKYAAFEQLRTRTYQRGENVDAYFADLQRLSELAGIEAASVAFVVGMPGDIGNQLRTMEAPTDSELVARARVLIEASRSDEVVAAATLANARQPREEGRTCYYCRQVGYFFRECPSRPKRKPKTNDVTCQLCSRSGHSALECQRPTENVNGAAATATPAAVPMQ
ncbi:MAG: hypothetical protein AAF438_20220 [Pseudomonadota bacterium]